MQIAEPRVSLKLEGRRLDADSFILSANGQDFKSRFREWSIPKFVVPVDLDLKIDSIGLGQEDLFERHRTAFVGPWPSQNRPFRVHGAGRNPRRHGGKGKPRHTRRNRRESGAAIQDNRIVSPAISTGSISARRSFVFSMAGPLKRHPILPSCRLSSRSIGCA